MKGQTMITTKNRIRRTFATVAVGAVAFTGIGLAAVSPASAADSNDGFYSIAPQDSWSYDTDRAYQPLMDFDEDGCLAGAAVDAAGQPNPGLGLGGAVNGNCRDSRDLSNTNTFARSASPNGADDVTGHMYAYYFEKDQSTNGVGEIAGGTNGHRHDWEHVIVWTKNGSVIGVSNSKHSGWEHHAKSDVPFDGDRPLMKYHKDGGLTHYIRAAHAEDRNYVTNPSGQWQTAPLISWDFLSDPVRNTLENHDYGDAYLQLRSGSFQGSLSDRWNEFSSQVSF